MYWGAIATSGKVAPVEWFEQYPVPGGTSDMSVYCLSVDVLQRCDHKVIEQLDSGPVVWAIRTRPRLSDAHDYCRTRAGVGDSIDANRVRGRRGLTRQAASRSLGLISGPRWSLQPLARVRAADPRAFVGVADEVSHDRGDRRNLRRLQPPGRDA